MQKVASYFRECCAVRKTIRDYKTVSVYNLTFEF
jgi:hypothetical protein